MAYLEKLLDADRDLLIALPYRAGLWVSMSDSSGGEEADKAERAALSMIVTGFVEDYCKSEFVEEIMRQTLQRRDHWDEWATNIETVPVQIRKAIEAAAQEVDHREIASFKSSLMDIAMTVAMAYREFDQDNADAMEKARVYSRYFLATVESAIRGEDKPAFNLFINISAAENKAIRTLAQALKMKTPEGAEPASIYEEAS